MSCSAETASRMKSKLPACFCISLASRETTTSWAPNRRASSFLLGDVVKTTTWAPNARANFTPMWPNPPSPTIPTFLSLPTFQRRIGEYVVIPAQRRGAAAARFKFEGTRSTNLWSTTMLSEYPPYVTPPRCLSGIPNVRVKLGQKFSKPARHSGHVPSESTRQPTAARSPGLNLVTAEPTFVTRPTISCPGTIGYVVDMNSLHSFRVACKSEWQIPQKRISICTSCSEGSRREIVLRVRGDVALAAE